ncbi:MAG: hypothetical protein OXH79_02570 [Boseongicola sp.]|nr:hypothetical protein [Boseongicola sp.]
MSRTLDKLLASGVTGIAFVFGRVHVMHVYKLFFLPTRGIRVFHLMMMPPLLFLARLSGGRL